MAPGFWRYRNISLVTPARLLEGKRKRKISENVLPTLRHMHGGRHYSTYGSQMFRHDGQLGRSEPSYLSSVREIRGRGRTENGHG